MVRLHVADNSRARAWAHSVVAVRDLQVGTGHQSADSLRNRGAELLLAEVRRNPADRQREAVRRQEVRRAGRDEAAAAAELRESAADSLACPWRGCLGLQEVVRRVGECPKLRGSELRSSATERIAASPR